jgi:hypothetical protein
MLSSFDRSKGLIRQLPGHVGYPNDCLPVFHPEFPSFCDQLASSLSETTDDPWLLGHFSDNEMPLSVLERSLQLPPDDPDVGPGYHAAATWLTDRRGPGATVDDVSGEDHEAWVEYVIDRYLAITTGAIRRHDSHHLCLGPRFHGRGRSSPGVWRAAGRYLDVIAINYYDSNKGIVTIRYDAYTPLLDAMKALNEQVYALVDYVEGQNV